MCANERKEEGKECRPKQREHNLSELTQKLILLLFFFTTTNTKKLRRKFKNLKYEVNHCDSHRTCFEAQIFVLEATTLLSNISDEYQSVFIFLSIFLSHAIETNPKIIR